MKPLILITNDDGVRSPGLLAAANAVADLGDLLIVAPATQQTGMGRGALQVQDGVVRQVVLQVGDRKLTAYAVPGSPAQAAMYGLLVLARDRRLALAVSGINYGENVGSVTTASGTVGAALEAAAYGVPGLAISLETQKDYHFSLDRSVDWSVAAHFTRQFAKIMLNRSLPFDVDVLKVDVPSGASTHTPWRLARQSRQPYYETFPVGHNGSLPELGHFDYRVAVDEATLEPDSDIRVFAGDRAVAVTPLSIDLTSRTDLTALQGLLQGAQGIQR